MKTLKSLVMAATTATLIPVASFASSKITFDNQSGKPALVKLVGPTTTTLTVENAKLESLLVAPGHYFIKIRYGSTGAFSYSKGDEFDVKETSTASTDIRITLHKLIGGNYGSKQITEQEFAETGKPLSLNAPRDRWQGNIAERRSAILSAARAKPVDQDTIKAIVEAMSTTVDEIEPTSSTTTTGSSDPFKSAGKRPALIGACCEALVRIGESAFQPALNGLNNDNKWVRYGCVWVLGRLGNKDAVVALCKLLERPHADDDLFAEAALSLTELRDKRCVSVAVKTLEEAQGDAVVHSCLLRLLTQIDQPTGVKWCLLAAKNSKPGIRDAAARAAGYLSDSESADLLLRLLNDDNTSVRGIAARALARRQEKAAEPVLLQLATDNSAPPGERTWLRVQAAWALARLNNDTGRTVLEELSKDAKGFPKEVLAAVLAKSPVYPGDFGGKSDEFRPRIVSLGEGVYGRIE